ncbi:MAG: pyruvate kinase [Methanoregulaceae archaeon]|nr:pyruvate kinase [Methanoregulaceae archaeon]
MPQRRTKIVCTLGPAVDSEAQIRRLIRAGMNVARLNCSHGDWDTKRRWIEWIRRHSPDVSPVGILADLQGPKFRLGVIADGVREIRAGEHLTVGPSGELPIHQAEILTAMGPGNRILLGDGDVEIRLGAAQGENFAARAISGGIVKSKQGVTLVGKVFHTSCLTEKDLKDIEEACSAGVDFIALSYVHRASDIRDLRTYVEQYRRGIRLCAKIETRDAVKNIHEIAAESDLLMVARGDMGLQMEIEDVPLAQKKIIRAARRASKPVITATQMLESMTNAPRPTRAEATDVANAILDGTDAVMLSGETAAGKYPLEAVRYMARIAEKAEGIFDDRTLLELEDERTDEATAIAHAVARLAKMIRPKAILTTTTSGQTARLMSKYRPRVPILCATWNSSTYHQMSVVWGVEAVHMGLPSSTDEQIEQAIESFTRRKRLKLGDTIIVSAGVPAGTPGNTNLIMVIKVGQG